MTNAILVQYLQAVGETYNSASQWVDLISKSYSIPAQYLQAVGGTYNLMGQWMGLINNFYSD
jgi:hypothetical protein